MSAYYNEVVITDHRMESQGKWQRRGHEKLPECTCKICLKKFNPESRNKMVWCKECFEIYIKEA